MSNNQFVYAMAWRLTPDWLRYAMQAPHGSHVSPWPVASNGEWPHTLLRQNQKTVQGLCAGVFIQPIAQR
ncbi:hypothetical protein [Lampropedia aestuarii]|uniref:hypothetical protein n=1 Tax=Lampropedia aestuarii TaxID=2562762 RepID=UPI002469ADE5|nr:hypothetical protein [Lampropedia aestuarii]MDH5856023.1 hypothetical protein [Lampropedia aestuarii]